MENMTNLPAITVTRYNALMKQINLVKTRLDFCERKLELLERSLRNHNG